MYELLLDDLLLFVATHKYSATTAVRLDQLNCRLVLVLS